MSDVHKAMAQRAEYQRIELDVSMHSYLQNRFAEFYRASHERSHTMVVIDQTGYKVLQEIWPRAQLYTHTSQWTWSGLNTCPSGEYVKSAVSLMLDRWLGCIGVSQPDWVAFVVPPVMRLYGQVGPATVPDAYYLELVCLELRSNVRPPR